MDSYKNRIKELSLLFEISKKLDESLDLKKALLPVLTITAGDLGMKRGMVTILDREINELSIREAYGLTCDEIERGRYKIGEGITGKVVKTGEPVIVPKISEEASFLNKTGAGKKHFYKTNDISFICVPIKIENEVIGSLSFDREYDAEHELNNDLKLIKIVASLISQAVKLRQSAYDEIEKIKYENKNLHNQLKVQFAPGNIVGNSKQIREVYSLMEKVLNNRTTVLIRGESGTGKELIAQAIHYNSDRSEGPFIRVNCASLPENLIESELFGHEKGAFTDASVMRKGRFELADNGTIFLDEIGDIPQTVQIKLLRVLQEKQIERIGSGRSISINVRIICATHQDLEKLIENRKFRIDLYYRINVFPLFIPPLRERKDDMLLLADHFAEKYGKASGKKIIRISSSAVDMMMNYNWPGNVRELENCIERAVLLSSDFVIHGYHMPVTLQTASMPAQEKTGRLEQTLNNAEKDIVIDALKSFKGNITKAASYLGLTERKMGLRIAKYSIIPGKYKPSFNKDKK